MLARMIVCAVALTTCTFGASAASEGEWLSLGSKHWAPTVFRKSGIDTEHALAEARVTRGEIQGWCENWSPGDRGCVDREFTPEVARTLYRASADCVHGRITPVDGSTYTLAGYWDSSDIGGGRTRWRDASGRIVGRDNASGGLGISQQWEVLCPASAGPSRAAAPRAAPSRAVSAPAPAPRAPSAVPPAVVPRTAPGAPAAAPFAAGQVIEARYGSGWVRGRIDSVQRVQGASGPEFAYNVRLDNGLRSQLPARMLRPATSR